MNRREFLGSGVATAALTLAGPVSAMPERRRDALVVFDSRFAEARLFASVAAEEYGLRTFGFVEDATALWHDHLVSALNQGSFVIGLTAGGARFCVHLMAGPGMRIAHHITHAAGTSVPQHACWTGKNGADQELRCASVWPEQAARIAVRRVTMATDLASSLTISRQYPAYHLPAADHLESWVLAPATAAMRSGARFLEERIS